MLIGRRIVDIDRTVARLRMLESDLAEAERLHSVGARNDDEVRDLRQRVAAMKRKFNTQYVEFDRTTRAMEHLFREGR
jgi:hypothetical protein